MVTTPENLLQTLASRAQWNLKDMTKKDAWMLRTTSPPTHGPSDRAPEESGSTTQEQSWSRRRATVE